MSAHIAMMLHDGVPKASDCFLNRLYVIKFWTNNIWAAAWQNQNRNVSKTCSQNVKHCRFWSDWSFKCSPIWVQTSLFKYLSRSMTKPTKWPVRPAKTQISLGICPVWSVFAVRMKKAWVLSYLLSAQRRLWSVWLDAQADLSLCWAHISFVGFVMLRLKYLNRLVWTQIGLHLKDQSDQNLHCLTFWLHVLDTFLLKPHCSDLKITVIFSGAILYESHYVFGITDQVRLKPACLATETRDFAYRNYKYYMYTIQAANNKGADQTAQMRKLVCAFVVRIWQKQVFSWRGSYSEGQSSESKNFRWMMS